MFSYQQSYDKSISDDLKKRFRKEIEVLEHKDFSLFGLHREAIWPFSVVLFFPVYLMMASNEYIRIKTPLRITSYHLMYVSKDTATLAYVYGLGCKFYTKFVDGTWLVSNTAQNVRDEKIIILKREPEAIPTPTEQVWKEHQAKIEECQAKGMRLAARVSFENWVGIESQFDKSNVMSVVSLGLIWLVFVIWAIYWLAMNGINLFKIIF